MRWVYGLLFRVLQLVGDRAGSATLKTTGLALDLTQALMSQGAMARHLTLSHAAI